MEVTSRRRSRRSALIPALVAMLAAVLLPASAQAAFSLSGLVAQPDSTQAGAHSNFNLHVGFPDAGTDVKSVVIGLPPGLVGDPTATPLCKPSQLNSDNCPAASQVGNVTSNVTVKLLDPLLDVPLTVNGSLYNLEAHPGEPARFGIVLRPLSVGPLPVLPNIILQSAVQLRTTDYGLNTIINNIPNTASGLSTHIDSMDVHLFGMAGSPPKPFMRNPTSCSLATTAFSATDYAGHTATGAASFTPTSCSALDFSPAFSASIGAKGMTKPPASPPLTTVVEQDVGEAGVKDVSVVLPQGVAATNAQLNTACSETAFAAGTCPMKTIVGSATARSPLLTQPLTGPVVVLAPATVGSLPRLGLDLRGPLHIQLLGSFILTADGPGNAFASIPDIPLAHFALRFDADKLVGISRDLCADPVPTFKTDFTGWNGATQSGDVAATVKGCAGGGGGSAKPRAHIRVGRAASKKPRLRLVTKAGDKKIAKTKLRLPKRLRFAKGRDFRDGFSTSAGKVLSHKRRSVVVGTGKRGTAKVVEKAGRGALLRRHRIAGRKLHFRLRVTDKAGKTTKLRLAATAKP